jgi:XTP/dITP diphosphohydrolase
VEIIEVVIATRNSGKLREIRQILAPLGLRILSLRDFPEIPEILEDGRTFAENAAKKATPVARLTRRVAIADDSGLAVDALDGRPGVFSSRYAGEGASDLDRYHKLLQEMAGVPLGQRAAVFVCAMAVASPEGKVEIVEGECRGEIASSPRGNEGFGYDPVFFFPDLQKTMAELEPEAKNRISHRARALEKLKQILPNFLEENP